MQRMICLKICLQVRARMRNVNTGQPDGVHRLMVRHPSKMSATADANVNVYER